MHDPTSHDELTSFEARLAALVPATRLDRDRLLYAAGKRAGRRGLRITQTLLAAVSVASGALVALVVLDPRVGGESPDGAAPGAASLAGSPDVKANPAGASVDGAAPTNYQLLRRLANDRDARVAASGTTPPRVPDGEAAPADRRSLLKHFLETAPRL
jgi:hypothetical protein